ncbi:hypothetical protein GGH96_003325 [Coemansia sp. RSA 1972]|nr:hypothetical protein GGH96_003325 [Coemansia sp. RSA 1972]
MSQAATRFSRAFIARAMNAPSRASTLQPGTRLCANTINTRLTLASRGIHTSPHLRQSVEPPSLADIVSGSVHADPVLAGSMQIGDLASHGLTTMLPVRLTEYALEFMHVSTGLPWWAAIGAVVIGYRLLILPVNAWSQKHMMNAMQGQPDMNRITAQIKAANVRRDYMSAAKHSQELIAIRKKLNISVVKPMVGTFLQIPFMMVMFAAVRDLATIPAAHMSTGGALWFTNLMAADPYMILPVISALGTMGTFELQSKLNSSVEQSREMKILFRCIAVLGAAVTSGLSSSVLLFWVYNTAFTVLQILVFSAKPFRRFMGIPDVKKVKFARPPATVLDKLNVKKFVGMKSKNDATPFVLPRKSSNKNI